MAGAGSTKDLYAILGVARDADDDAIKQAYRKLARTYHPDVSQEADAEERFKAVSEAYAVLSSPDRRRNYDEFGEIALDPNFDAERAREMRSAFGRGAGGFPFGSAEFTAGDRGADGSTFGGLEDLLGGLFGGFAAPNGPVQGADMRAEIELDFLDAARGGERRLGFWRPGPDGQPVEETLSVRIPPGVSDGGQIRLAGKGAPGANGGPPGDLRVRIRVRPHRVFRRDGRDLHLDLPVTVAEATLGADVEVPTLEGRVKLRIPAGTDSGAKLRLRGKGVPGTSRQPAGDLYAHVKVRVPRALDDAARAAVAALAEHGPHDVRDELFEQAV